MMSYFAMLESAGIVERDKFGDVIWAWSFPHFTKADKEFVLNKCCLFNHVDSKTLDVVPFVYAHHNKRWFYLASTAVGQNSNLLKVTHFCIIITSKDFNPKKYKELARILVNVYDLTGDPVLLLERYLSVATFGTCKNTDNEVFSVEDFDAKSVHKASGLKDVINRFGVESIYLYTAVLLKKRVLVYSDDIEEVLTLTRALPTLVWHRLDFSNLYPWIEETEELVQIPSFIAGTSTKSLMDDELICDVFVDASHNTIRVASHSKEVFSLGKIHKDIARTMVELADDDNVTDQRLIEVLANKTSDLLEKLKSLGNDGDLSLDAIQSRGLSAVNEMFLINLAYAERLIEVQ